MRRARAWPAVAAGLAAMGAAEGGEPATAPLWPGPRGADLDLSPERMGAVDWAERRIVVEGVGLAPASWDGMVARRAASARIARAEVARRLLEEVAGLQVEGDGSAGRGGPRLAASPALHRAVIARLGRAQKSAARFFSDGGVSLRAALSLEAVADLLLFGVGGPPAPPPRPTPPAATPATYTGLAVDARQANFVPRLRLALALPGGEVLADAGRASDEGAALIGPAAFVRDVAVALRQVRLGPRPLWVRGRAGAGAMILEDLPAAAAAEVAALCRAGRVVVVY